MIDRTQEYMYKEGDYPKSAINVDKVDMIKNSVKFYDMGGGFLKSCSIDTFNERFREVTEQDKETQPYLAYFSIDQWEGEPDHSIGMYKLKDYEGVAFKGYTHGYSWNGWATPCFEYETALYLINDMNMMEETDRARYDEESDSFIIKAYDYPEEDDPEVYEGADIIVNGETKHVYGIGSGFWCWDTYKESEVSL